MKFTFQKKDNMMLMSEKKLMTHISLRRLLLRSQQKSENDVHNLDTENINHDKEVIGYKTEEILIMMMSAVI